MKEPLKVLAYVSSDLVNDRRAFHDAKTLGGKILEMLQREGEGYRGDVVLFALYLTVCALIDAIELRRKTPLS